MKRGFSLRQSLHSPDHDNFVMNMKIKPANSNSSAITFDSDHNTVFTTHGLTQLHLMSAMWWIAASLGDNAFTIQINTICGEDDDQAGWQQFFCILQLNKMLTITLSLLFIGWLRYPWSRVCDEQRLLSETMPTPSRSIQFCSEDGNQAGWQQLFCILQLNT